MKQIFLKWLFNGYDSSQYKTYRIPKNDIFQKVVLKSGEALLDISFHHAVLVQVPFMLGVCLSKDQKITTEYLVNIYSKDMHLSTSKCKLYSKVEFENFNILFLQIISNQHHNISWLKQKALLYTFHRGRQHNVLYSELDGFFATYSFPREIMITSFYSDTHFNIFPTDLIGNWSDKGLLIIGLRNTNVTIKELLASKKFVVSNIDGHEKKNIFQLGAHHSTAPPSIENLPFELIKTEVHQMYVPSFAKEYRELEIIKHFTIGTHTVMICEIRNHVVIDSKYASLYHIHKGVLIRQKLPYELY